MNDNMIIANIKGLGIDMINNAGSGHPGIVLGAAPMLYALYKDHMKINVSDCNWVNRDRFVMSAGHGSALLYATLFVCGFGLTVDDLKAFRQINSKTPGHPERGITPGVDCSTGPLGQGIANAVGLAIGEKTMRERYRINKDTSLIDYSVYCLAGDGDLMEGISYEAASLAGHLKLDNLIVLYDSNNISLDGPTNQTFTENVRKRFEAMGWETLYVKDGTNVEEINKAIIKAKRASVPVLIEVKTIIGNGSINAGTSKVHGAPLDENDIRQLKYKLGLPDNPFFVNNDNCNALRGHIADRVNNSYMEWTKHYQAYVLQTCEGDKTVAGYLFDNTFDYDLFAFDWGFNPGMKQPLRDTNNMFIKVLSNNVKTFIGGSADVGSTTKTLIDNGDLSANNFLGGNIWFGVREHAMGAILNGLALANMKPFGSTFLSFADYLKPAMRMSAIMHLPVTYVFTHDSVTVGPDGPTHQPIEQLAMMRSIPGMKVYRPADPKELLGCWHAILNSNNNPSALVVARNDVELLDQSDASKTAMGGYVIKLESTDLSAVIIATGTEVNIAKNIALQLEREGNGSIRVVSMPCVETFLDRGDTYKENVLPEGIKRIVIEAGSSFGWHRVVNDPKCMICLDEFGYSGTKEEILTAMNFSYPQILERVKELL